MFGFLPFSPISLVQAAATVAPSLHLWPRIPSISTGGSSVASSPATSQEVSRPEAGPSNHWACPKVVFSSQERYAIHMDMNRLVLLDEGYDAGRKQLELAGNGHVSSILWLVSLGLDTPGVVPSAPAPACFFGASWEGQMEVPTLQWVRAEETKHPRTKRMNRHQFGNILWSSEPLNVA